MSAAPVAIGPDHHVTIAYAIFDDQALEPTPGAEQLTETFVHGYGQVLPALEDGLVGKLAGTHVTLVANPDDAFGAHEAEGIFELDKQGLEGANELEPGEEVMATGPEGDILMRVIEVRPETLIVDTNHPLAGKRVRFEIDIVEVRPATEDEIQEAQAELENDACGCGHEHATHDHEPENAAGNGLVQLDLRRAKQSSS